MTAPAAPRPPAVMFACARCPQRFASLAGLLAHKCVARLLRAGTRKAK